MITEWWTSLDTMMKILWGITISASLIFVIETVLTFIGADSGGDFDTDFGGDADIDASHDGADGTVSSGSNLYTFRNFVNFFLGFGWTSIVLRSSISSTFLLFLIAFAIGVGLVVLVMYLFKWLYSMQQSGNIDVFKSAVGCQGKVYLTIPALRQGSGKVQITINNSVREYDAITDSDINLKTGTPIRVSEVIDASTVVVEELESLII